MVMRWRVRPRAASQPSARLLKHRVASLTREHRSLHLRAAGEDAPDQHDPTDWVPDAKEQKGERYRHSLPEVEANDTEQQRADADEEAEENTEAEDDVAEGHGAEVAA